MVIHKFILKISSLRANVLLLRCTSRHPVIRSLHKAGNATIKLRRMPFLPSNRTKTKSPLLIALGAMCLTLFSGCGYHQAGAATHLPANVRTLAVPIFASKVQAYNTEVAFTQAVVHELNLRTR